MVKSLANVVVYDCIGDLYSLVDVSIIWLEAKLTLQKKNFNIKKKSTIMAASMEVVSMHAQKVAPSIYVIFEVYYVGNQGNCDVKLQVTMTAIVQCEQGAVNVLNSDLWIHL